MSTMNILSATLVLIILGAGLAVFFGMRAAAAGHETAPLLVPQAINAQVAPDTMDNPGGDI